MREFRDSNGSFSQRLTERFSPVGQGRGLARFVRAQASPNLALVKYWGKRDTERNLPAVGSLSLTLAPLQSEVFVRPLDPRSNDDEITGNGVALAGEAREKIQRFLDLVRARAGETRRLKVEVQSNFPVAAGLASSSSTFAALAVALDALFDLQLDPRDLSALARQGSGSAARSIFGGFVEWLRGSSPDGSDSVAVPIAPPDHWPLRVLVAVTNPRPKRVSSTLGMRSTQNSPFFAAWENTQEADLAEARAAVATRDLHRLGEVAEHSALKMHALMIASRPALLYWEAATVAVIHTVYELRRSGLAAYFSIDAGPQVKVLCQPDDCARVAAALRAVPGVLEVLDAEPGPGAAVLEVQS